VQSGCISVRGIRVAPARGTCRIRDLAGRAQSIRRGPSNRYPMGDESKFGGRSIDVRWAVNRRSVGGQSILHGPANQYPTRPGQRSTEASGPRRPGRPPRVGLARIRDHRGRRAFHPGPINIPWRANQYFMGANRWFMGGQSISHRRQSAPGGAPTSVPWRPPVRGVRVARRRGTWSKSRSRGAAINIR